MLFCPYRWAAADGRLRRAVSGGLSSPRVILVGIKSSRPLVSLFHSLLMISFSVDTKGSGSWCWLRLWSVSRRWASLSGLNSVMGFSANQPMSPSGGGQRLVTVSETRGLLAPHPAKQPASVSTSAGLGRGAVVSAVCPLSAVLWFSPRLVWFSWPHRGRTIGLLGQLIHVDRLLHLV